MKNYTLHERIVKLKKTNTDGIESLEEAELRQIDMYGMEPRSISVVLAREFGVQLTMQWDGATSNFSTEIGGMTWTSDFDYKNFVQSPWDDGKNYVRSPRRK